MRSELTLLLDVNVLLALLWPRHPAHRAVRRRLERHSGRWATCALTQLGFIRISCNPAFAHASISPELAAAALLEGTRDASHVFFNSLPAPSIQAFRGATGHQQVADRYLIQLASFHEALLYTLDRRLSESAPGLCLLEPSA